MKKTATTEARQPDIGCYESQVPLATVIQLR